MHSPQPQGTDPAREEVASLIPAYSVGATDPDEEATIKAQMAQCPQAVAELADYAEMAQALLYSAPLVRAPAYLADRLREAVAATAVTEAAEPVPPPATEAPGEQPGFWTRVGQALRRALNPGQWQPGQVAAVVAVLLLLVTNLYWLDRVNRLRTVQGEMSAQLEQQHAALALAWTEGTQWVRLPAAQAESHASAVVIWKPEQHVAVLYVEAFPVLSAQQVYQIWLIRGEERISGGLFSVNAEGHATLVIRAPMPIDRFDAVGITPEPAGGSPGPTAPPVVRGKLAL